MGPTQHASWSPYDNNGGCCVAVAGEDYCVVAADTRMSTGFSIMTRDCEKIVKLCVSRAHGVAVPPTPARMRGAAGGRGRGGSP